MSVELYTLEGTDDEVEELIAFFRFNLGAAQEAEILHPETVSSLRKWCSVEWARIHPKAESVRADREAEMRAALRQSRWYSFWESLEAGQEVRWTGTKTATYFVVDPNPVPNVPGTPQSSGAYIELRRHSGKTFWTHIGQVRPLENLAH